MDPTEAVAFLRPAIDPRLRVWADLGAGSGTFTAALTRILVKSSTIYAVDNDPDALRRISELQLPDTAAIIPVHGDIGDLDAITDLNGLRWDGVILANVLHYSADPSRILKAVAARLSSGGRVVLVEYDRPSANRWVPYPIPVDRATDLATATGFAWGGIVARRPSQYQGTMYCAVLTPMPRRR